MTTNRWKSMVAGLTAAVAIAGMVAPARAVNPVNTALVHTEMYIWNRFADLLETVRGGIAIGPAIGAEVAVTDKAVLGAYTSQEEGATFPHVLPPLWVVPILEGDKVFDVHEGEYWTYAVGPRRWESGEQRDVRFPRSPYDVRAQLAAGLAHFYLNLDLQQVGDFISGFVLFDPMKDDEEIRPNVSREPARQLGRGVSNVVTGIWEVPFNMHQVNEDQGGFAAVTYGLFRGLWRFGVREAVGVLEIVTFPFGWEPIVEPEFPFQHSRSTDWRVNPLPFIED